MILAMLLLGFLAGVLVNLLADYLPARRHDILARTSPFATRNPDMTPPRFLPERPLHWSGVVALLSGQAPGQGVPHPVRRALVEIGLMVAFVGLGSTYPTHTNLAFFLFYAAALTLIAVIDIEHRWILFDTLWPLAFVAVLEAVFWPRFSLGETIQGGLLGFGVGVLLWLFGIVFGKILGAVSGRAAGRTIFGFGDALLAGVGGLILGIQAIGPALLFMMLSGGAASAFLVIAQRFRRRRSYRRLAIPYAPHIVLGVVVMLYLPWVALDLFTALLAAIR